MTTPARPADMSDLEWLVAMEEIRQLKARRDRYVDAHDWDALQALHAPDHISYHSAVPGADEPVAWTTSDEMIRNVKYIMTEIDDVTIHHSYDPEIHFDSKTNARGVWAMCSAKVSDGTKNRAEWQITHGYYYETYEKREGRWLFTTRRWHRYIATGAKGVIFPVQPISGSEAFDFYGKDFGNKQF